MSLDTDPPTPIQPLVAWRALMALRRDPQDTRQVFILGEAIKGKSPSCCCGAFAKTRWAGCACASAAT